MKAEDIHKIMVRGDRTALLLGEITGRLSLLSLKVTEAVYGSELKNYVDELYNMVITRIDSIYYEEKNDAS